MHRLKSKKLVTLIVICCTIMTMTIVCASFNQNMYINGNAYVRASKDVRIKNVVVKSADNGAQSNSLMYSSKRFTVDASLPNLDSQVVYTVTVENRSNSDVYIIKNITGSFSNDSITNDSSEYINQIIGSGETVDIDVTFKYGVDSLPDLKNQSGTLIFTFEYPSAAIVSFSSEYTTKTNVQDAIDELYSLVN